MKLPVGHVPGVGVHKATAFGGLGEKLLRGWGWEKGQGLGKEKQGISSAIEVKKKDDNSGIGGANRYQWDEKWWEAAFNANAQSIADAAGASGYESDSDSSDSDEEELRTCAAGLKRNRDGTLASGSAAELQIAATVAKDARGWAGRFGGREGKMERIRKQEAEQAAAARKALGLPDEVLVAPQTPPKKKDSKEKAKKAKAEDDSESSKPSKKKQKKEEKAKKNEKKKASKEKENTTGDEVSSEEDGGSKGSSKKDKKKKDKKDKKTKDTEEEEVPRHVFKPLPANWWGCKYFVSAGAMTGLEQSEEAKKRQEFTEDSQEALYNRAQGSKVAGRQGLGVRGSKIKMSGGDYQGKKIAFEEEDGDKEDEKEEKGSSGKDSSEEDAGVEGIKWKKLIAKTLKGEESGEMKVKKLQKRVAAAALKQLDSKASVSVERLEGIVLKKLKSCSKFVVEGKVARCC